MMSTVLYSERRHSARYLLWSNYLLNPSGQSTITNTCHRPRPGVRTISY